jgi:predicted HAD superfamily Cof-like phosphohydrolase
MTLRDQVAEFHRAFDAPVHGTPRVPPQERIELRLRLIAEEFCELLGACGCDPRTVGMVQHEIAHAMMTELKANIVEVADALGDLDYVIEGTRLEFGIDGAPIADAIHRSNIRKAGGAVREDGKIQKPEGWAPPDIRGCLIAQGWSGTEAESKVG